MSKTCLQKATQVTPEVCQYQVRFAVFFLCCFLYLSVVLEWLRQTSIIMAEMLCSQPIAEANHLGARTPTEKMKEPVWGL